MLKIGDSVALELGGSAKILSVLGSGGQGTVYKAEFGGKEYALKMYFANKLRSPEIFRENLSRLTEDKIDDAFVMPIKRFITCTTAYRKNTRKSCFGG